MKMNRDEMRKRDWALVCFVVGLVTLLIVSCTGI